MQCTLGNVRRVQKKSWGRATAGDFGVAGLARQFRGGFESSLVLDLCLVYILSKLEIFF